MMLTIFSFAIQFYVFDIVVSEIKDRKSWAPFLRWRSGLGGCTQGDPHADDSRKPNTQPVCSKQLVAPGGRKGSGNLHGPLLLSSSCWSLGHTCLFSVFVLFCFGFNAFFAVQKVCMFDEVPFCLFLFLTITLGDSPKKTYVWYVRKCFAFVLF